jgi:hypothetical protein
MYVHRSRDGLIAWISARARRMAGGDASASRDALARAVAAAKAASRPRLASVFAKSSDPRYAPRPEANYGERWEAQEALATVAGAGPAAAKLGLEHPEHETRDGAACGETRMGDASTSGRPNDSNEAPVDGNRPVWVETVDGDTGVPYYFNLTTRETSWEAPQSYARLLKHDGYESNLKVSPGSVGDDRGVVRVEAAAAAAAVNDDDETPRSADDEKKRKKYWYRDDAGAWRGPYSFDRLQFWRASLPALLPVVDFDPDDKSTVDGEEKGDVESRAIALANLLGDEVVFARAAALGIAAHPRATAAQVERAIADVRARPLAARERDDDDDDDATNPRASRDALITDRAAARRAIDALPKTHRDAILGGAFDPSEAARAVANAAFRSVPETATLNRVTGRLSVRSNASTAFDRGGADTRTGDARKSSRPTAGPRPGPAEVAAYKERKRKRRDAWLDT